MPDTLTSPPAEATVGHNSAAVGEMIDADPAVIFREPDLVPTLFDEIEKSITDHEPDTSTEAGRKAIASLAYRISTTKTRLDAAGKALNEDHRAAINKVDAVRKTIRDRLDELRDTARAPLSEWEAEEAQFDARVSGTLSRLEAAARPPAGSSAADLAAEIKVVEAIKITAELFRTKTDQVTMVRDRVLANLRAAHASTLKAEEAQAELARIKEEQAEKERIEAEAKAKADREAAQAKAAEEQRRKAEADKKAAADAAALKAREAEKKAAQKKIDAANAEKQAAADALAKKLAEEAEAKRKADAEAAERKRREADDEHRKRVIKAAVLAMSEQTGTDVEVCRQIVLAIAAGQVPAVTITF